MTMVDLSLSNSALLLGPFHHQKHDLAETCLQWETPSAATETKGPQPADLEDQA